MVFSNRLNINRYFYYVLTIDRGVDYLCSDEGSEIILSRKRHQNCFAMMASLNDRVSLVTGAARGIGLTISKALLDHGGKVRILKVMEATHLGRLWTDIKIIIMLIS